MRLTILGIIAVGIIGCGRSGVTPESSQPIVISYFEMGGIAWAIDCQFVITTETTLDLKGIASCHEDAVGRTWAGDIDRTYIIPNTTATEIVTLLNEDRFFDWKSMPDVQGCVRVRSLAVSIGKKRHTFVTYALSDHDFPPGSAAGTMFTLSDKETMKKGEALVKQLVKLAGDGHSPVSPWPEVTK